METISWSALAWCLLPVTLVMFVFMRWHTGAKDALIASTRMVLQLVAMGYILVLLFARPSWWVSLSVVTVMLLIATWISLRPVRHHPDLYMPALLTLGGAVAFHLALSVWMILDLRPWYQPNVLIPLAGMYLANTMNGMSLAVERYFAELPRQQHAEAARNVAFRAAMIPQINGLLAVGLVALPGMMTGQILSGVSPLIAVRYQIMIMTMCFGTTALGAASLLWWLAKKR